MSEKIVIDFDGEDKELNKDKNPTERIVIDLDEAEEKTEIYIDDLIEESYEETFLKLKINSFYKGDSYLNNSYNSELKFPEGIEQSFSRKFSRNLKDEFFNTILENNKYIILSSRTGVVYLVNRFTGSSEKKLSFDNESFEKTGLVYENTIYLNSLNKIICIKESVSGEIIHEEIYKSQEGFVIWSNLNRQGDLLLFTEYNISSAKAGLIIIDLKNVLTPSCFKFEVRKFISDKLCAADDKVYMLFDDKILIYHLDSMKAELKDCEIKTDENSFVFYLNFRLYITSKLNELYYQDLPALNYKFKTTGIKNSYINSIGGFEDNIFIGTLDGWKLYKSSGLQIYYFEDEFENKIESISKNILVISQNNKIVFCNLNRFQEAEGYVISSKNFNDPVEIVSAVISRNEIIILTKTGILEIFSNDKMNIHI